MLDAFIRAEGEPEAVQRLPRLMRIYASDFGGRNEQLRFAAARVPRLAERLADDERITISYGRFDWRVVPGPAS